jgi:hypothetical protein
MTLLLETVAKIKNPTEKGLFFAIASGIDTRQALLKHACFPMRTLDIGLKNLVSQNLIVRDGKTYRPVGVESAEEEKNSSADYSLPSADSFHSVSIERIRGLEAYRQFFDHVPREWIPGDVPSIATLFQSDLLKARIKSTAEIPDIIALLCERQVKTLEGRRRGVRKHFTEKELCCDLVDRIALLPLTLGIMYDVQFLETLKRTCDRYKEADNFRGKYSERKGFARLAVMVRELYERMGVIYTEYQLDTDYILDTEMKRIVGLQYEAVKQKVAPPRGDQPGLFDRETI